MPMTQPAMFPELEGHDLLRSRFAIGRAYELHLPRGPRSQGQVYHRGGRLKEVDLGEKAQRQLLAIELMQQGVNQSKLAQALKLSRQTLHNYRESYNKFGLEGLLHGYTPSESKSRETQRRLHVDQRRPGTKARELEQRRKQERAALSNNGELDLDPPRYELEEVAIEVAMKKAEEAQRGLEPSSLLPREELPFAKNHEGSASRYAGLFILLFPLLTQWRWLDKLFTRFGRQWRIFMIFLLMSGLNIRSIEQLKHIRQDEAGRVLGLGSLPSLASIWGWFHEAAQKGSCELLLGELFDDQIERGLVGARLWFTDGHLLPYTGKARVHASYNTQRRMPVPGQTNLVTCDERGRIVRFEIQEGKGELRDTIFRVGEYGKVKTGQAPIQVFDREGHGVEFFSRLVNYDIPFATWEKHADKQHLDTIKEEAFTHRFEFNGKGYRVLEETKPTLHKWIAENGEPPQHSFELRRIVIWNLSSNRRASGLCWDGERGIDLETFAQAILQRWGASENTFKHLNERHPPHYHPGFGLGESEKQEIDHPQRQAITAELKSIRGQLIRNYKQLSKITPTHNRDGTSRANGKYQTLKQKIQELETRQAELRKEKKQLPKRIDVSQLQDYRSFKKIGNEGKNLFDFVTASVWNVRRTLIDWLGEYYVKDSDRVDLFYAILHSHGWIESDDRWVVVRLEPLQQPNRRYAQEQLCRKLTGLGAKIPGGKSLRIEVGDTPL
jgi:Winged helix-turn helix